MEWNNGSSRKTERNRTNDGRVTMLRRSEPLRSTITANDLLFALATARLPQKSLSFNVFLLPFDRFECLLRAHSQKCLAKVIFSVLLHAVVVSPIVCVSHFIPNLFQFFSLFSFFFFFLVSTVKMTYNSYVAHTHHTHMASHGQISISFLSLHVLPFVSFQFIRS